MLQVIVSSLLLGSIYLLFAIGLSLSWGVLNILNLAHGSMFMFGAWCTYVIGQHVDLNLPLLIVIGALIGGILSSLVYLVAYRPLLARAGGGHSAELGIMIASIGIGLIPVAIATNRSPAEVVSYKSDVTTTGLHSIHGVTFTTLQIWIFVIAVIVTALIAIVIAKTRSGRALRAVAADPGTANLLGVPVARLSLQTMFVSGLLAGLAGVLLAANANAIEPRMGDSLLLKAFAIVILGGVGSVPGALIGAFVLAFGETIAVKELGGNARDFIAFGLIILVLLIRPRGIFATAVGDRA